MGATVHLHYCMGKLVSWDLSPQESKNCSFCGMLKNDAGPDHILAKKNCCKDDHKELKAGGDQKPAQAEYQFLKFSPDLDGKVFHLFSSFPANEIKFTHPTTHAPPDSGKEPVYLLNCNFRV